MEREKKLVSLCLLILFVACVVVYLLLYQVKGKEILNLWWAIISTGNQNETLTSDQVSDLVFSGEDTWTLNTLSWVSNSYIATWSDARWSSENNSQTASTETNSQTQSDTIKQLSGTQLYFWVLDSAEVLGLSPDYILSDNKERYFAYFAKEPTTLRKTVQQLWWNIYSIKSEADLIKNELFGDRVDYINLPEYKEKMVLMLIAIGQERRLLQIPYKIYHQSKPYLKSLFT